MKLFSSGLGGGGKFLSVFKNVAQRKSKGIEWVCPIVGKTSCWFWKEHSTKGNGALTCGHNFSQSILLMWKRLDLVWSNWLYWGVTPRRGSWQKAIPVHTGPSLATEKARHWVDKPGQKKEAKDLPLRHVAICFLYRSRWQLDLQEQKGKGVGQMKQGGWESASIRKMFQLNL